MPLGDTWYDEKEPCPKCGGTVHYYNYGMDCRGHNCSRGRYCKSCKYNWADDDEWQEAIKTKTLIGLVGLPRSGKSTWARAKPWPIVNPDSIRLSLYGAEFKKEGEPMVWTIALYMVKSLFLAGHDTVVLDATNITKESRAKWISKEWRTLWHEIGTDEQTCIDRALKEERSHMVSVIRRMAANWEPLDDEPRYVEE